MLDLVHCFGFVSSCRTLAKYTDDLYDVYTQSFLVTPPSSALYLYLNVLSTSFLSCFVCTAKTIMYYIPTAVKHIILFILVIESHISPHNMNSPAQESPSEGPLSQTTLFTKKIPKTQSHLQPNHTSHLTPPNPPQPSHKIPNIPRRNIPLAIGTPLPVLPLRFLQDSETERQNATRISPSHQQPLFLAETYPSYRSNQPITVDRIPILSTR